MLTYVLNTDGQPLMPTERCGKVRRLLKSGQAKVVRRCPFTIKLLYKTTDAADALTLGMDTGSGTLAAAVTDTRGNILYMSEVTVRNDIRDKMDERRIYRRSRRSRKTRYRKPRFDNRASSRREERLSPTMTSKLHSHEKEIAFVKSILPVTRLVLETGTFDTHLMQNPALEDENIRRWGYQQGPNYGFENTKARVLCRDRYTCQCCKGRHKDSKLEVHHIVFRRNGGSDEAENLITLCHTCHKALHAGKISPDFKGRTAGSLKYATQMNSIRVQLLKEYPDAVETFGYITKANRLMLGVSKEHYYDACVIATGGMPFENRSLLYRKRCIPDGDFKKTQGRHSEQPVAPGKIMGFRKFDKVLYMGNEYFIRGRMSAGYAILMDFDGRKADFSHMPRGRKTPKLKDLKRVEARTTWMTTAAALM